MSNPIFSQLSLALEKKYVNTQVTSDSPDITTIHYSDKDPMVMEGGHMICECGKIIKQNYLCQHKASGACDRRKQAIGNRGKFSSNQ